MEGNYWQVSTDKGATWVDVERYQKVTKFRPEVGMVKLPVQTMSWVTVDGVEYIKIGDKVTDLKQNNEFPNIAVDAESKTVIMTIDGQELYFAGKVLHSKELQTVVYRKQAVDDA